MLTFLSFTRLLRNSKYFSLFNFQLKLSGTKRNIEKASRPLLAFFFFFVCWVTLSLSLDVCVNAEAVNWLKLTPSVLSLNCLRVLIKTKLFKLCYIQNPYFKVIRSSLCCFLSLRSAHRTIFLEGILFCCQ